MNNSNDSFEKLIIHSKVFESIKVPERNKRFKILQNNVMKLRNSLGLLNVSKPKRKINRKKGKKVNLTNSVTKSIVRNLNEEKKIKKFASLENFIPYNDSNNDNIIDNKQSKDINLLYMDRVSTLKRKNKELLNKMKKNENNENNENSYRDYYNINKNDIFMTESNLPKIQNNSRNDNGNHNPLRKVLTESNNYYENTINNILNNKKIINQYNLKTNNIILRSNSDKKMLPPIILTKKNILNMNKKKNNKNNKNDKNNISNDLNDRKEKSMSDINTEDKSDKNDNDNNNKNINKKKSLTIEAERQKILHKKLFSDLNNKVINIFGNNSSKNTNNPEINNLITSVNKINTNFKNKKFYHEIEKWIMSTKFKYMNWKYGIADINKYFIDMKEFGEKEEKELEMRKSFYEKVDSVINELKEDKEKKELKEIKNKYGININKEEKKIIKDNEYWNGDQANNKKEEMSKILKIMKERKEKEKKNKHLIEEIMFQCKKGINNINNL